MLLKNCELWYPRLDPKRPNSKFNKANPTWEVQLRTRSKEQKKEWEAAGLNVKVVVPDEGEMYFMVNLKKKSVKSDGQKASCPKIVDLSLEEIDPRTVANGSVGTVRVFQYENSNPESKFKLVNVLMGIQLTKHVVYTPKSYDDEFEAHEDAETEVVSLEDTGTGTGSRTQESRQPAYADGDDDGDDEF